jgi:hypothetical protein
MKTICRVDDFVKNDEHIQFGVKFINYTAFIVARKKDHEVDRYGFPPGTRLSPNIRVWDIDDVRRWLANRPTERKTIVAPHRSKDAEEAA